MIQQLATIGDLYEYDDGKAELVGGKIVPMSPTGGIPNYAASEIFAELRAYERRMKTGRAYTDNVAFLVDLANRGSFSPDAAYHPLRKLTPKFIDGAPIFAVEVRSEGDYGPVAEREMAAKRADYFAAGTLVVWDVDVIRELTIRSFTHDAPERPTVFTRNEIATVEPALPGFTFPVLRLLPDE